MKREHVIHLKRHAMPVGDVLRHPACGDSALGRLCREIDAAFSAVEGSPSASFGQRLRAALQRAAADPGLLRPDQRVGSPQNYCRHLLAADPLGRYAIAALVWEPGQASPVHGHQTWCGYAVIDGTLAETLFRWDTDTHSAVEVRRHPRETGAVSYVDCRPRRDDPSARQSRRCRHARRLALHVYGVTGEQIATHVNDLLAA